MPESVALDAVDRAIIEHLQGGFPISPQPYAVAATSLGICEADLLARLQRLLDARVLTRFGPLFQVERMGGVFLLAAMHVPPARWSEVVDLVNSFPEVAHNYQRESAQQCAFNMWFVLASESDAAVATTIRRIEEASGLPVCAFPKLREYFVDMRLAVRA